LPVPSGFSPPFYRNVHRAAIHKSAKTDQAKKRKEKKKSSETKERRERRNRKKTLFLERNSFDNRPEFGRFCGLLRDILCE